MLLHYQRTNGRLRHVRSFFDRRVYVTSIVAEYRGEDGESYRKAFECRGAEPIVPKQGTHAELNVARKQWS